MKKLVFTLIATSALVGCGNKVDRSVQQAVTDNQAAKNHLEWEASEAHPEVLFPQWQEEYISDENKREDLKKEVCEALLALDGQNLTIFENEIRSEANVNLLVDCKGQLLAKVDGYFDQQRSLMAVKANALIPVRSKNNFRFNDNVQKRDTTNGYLAWTGDVAKKEVILTFDDGPEKTYTDSILQSLREVNAKAIFFHKGANVRLNPDVVKRIAADGHSIGSHSVTHACLAPKQACRNFNGRLLSYDEAVAEIRGGHQAVYDVLGWVDPFFRFPFGENSPELRYFVKANSTGEFMWNVDSEDWKAGSDNQTTLRNTLAQVQAVPRGALVLFHDIQRKTAEILPQFLSELYTRGYSVVLLQPADLSVRYNSKLVKKRAP